MDRPLGCPSADAAAGAGLRLVVSDGAILGPPRRPAVSIKATRTRLDRDDSFDEAAARILSDCLDHFTANIPALRETGDAEAVHQLRVALRRLRAFLGLIGRVAPNNLELMNAAARAKTTAGALGVARDWHVLREGLEHGPREFLRDEPGLFLLLDAVESRRLRAIATARDVIVAPATQQFARELRGAISRRAWRESSGALEEKGSARVVAVRALNRLHRRAVKRSENIAEVTPEERHAARIALKKTRYAAEFFESLFERREARAYLRRLATIQEELGEDNDRRTAERLLGEITINDTARDTGRVDWFLRGWRARAQHESFAAAQKNERRLKRLKPFWR